MQFSIFLPYAVGSSRESRPCAASASEQSIDARDGPRFVAVKQSVELTDSFFGAILAQNLAELKAGKHGKGFTVLSAGGRGHGSATRTGCSISCEGVRPKARL